MPRCLVFLINDDDNDDDDDDDDDDELNFNLNFIVHCLFISWDRKKLKQPKRKQNAKNKRETK